VKNIKTFIKNNLDFILMEFTLFLILIGIFTALSAIKKDNYNNPSVYLLFVIYAVLYVCAGYFSINKTYFPKQQIYKEPENETEAPVKLHDSPPRKILTRAQEFFLKIIVWLLVAVNVIIFIGGFFIMLCLASKMGAKRGILVP